MRFAYPDGLSRWDITFRTKCPFGPTPLLGFSSLPLFTQNVGLNFGAGEGNMRFAYPDGLSRRDITFRTKRPFGPPPLLGFSSLPLFAQNVGLKLWSG